MEIKDITTLTRNLILDGETGKALETILAYLRQYHAAPEIRRILEVQSANYNAARQQEQKNILSFQEAQRIYSQVNDVILEQLDNLEDGKPLAAAKAGGNKAIYWWAGGAVVLLLLGIFIGRRFLNGKQQPVKEPARVECPPFNGLGPKVLILPFAKLQGDDSGVHVLLRDRITSLAENKKFPLNVQIVEKTLDNGAIFNTSTVERISNQCGADMVVYGQYIAEKGGAPNINAQFYLARKGIAGGTGFQRVQNLLNLKSSDKYRSLDDAVFSLCGVLAFGMQNDSLARTWFGKIQQRNEMDEQMWERLQTSTKRPVLDALREKKKGN